MEKIQHLWESTKFLEKFPDREANILRRYYVQKCRSMEKEVALPKQHFGPSKMCRHCGTLWSTTNRKVRVVRGRTPSKALEKLVRTVTDGTKKVTKFQASLVKKIQRNKPNKIIMKCSVCSQITKRTLSKPLRLKPAKKDANSSESLGQRKKKKKKKRNRDKTAGLNLSGIKVSEDNPNSTILPPVVKKQKEAKKSVSVNQDSPTKKTPMRIKANDAKKVTKRNVSKKLDIRKLQGIIGTASTATKQKSLHSFLKELG